VMRWIAVGEMHVLGLCGLRSVSKKSKGIFASLSHGWTTTVSQRSGWRLLLYPSEGSYSSEVT